MQCNPNSFAVLCCTMLAAPKSLQDSRKVGCNRDASLMRGLAIYIVSQYSVTFV